MKDERISILIDKATKTQIKIKCAKEGINMSKYIMRLITKDLQKV